METISPKEAERRDAQRERCLNERLNVDHAARYVGVSRSYLNKLRGIGGGPPYFKVGARVLYSLHDLDSWLAAHRRRSTADAGEAA